MPFISYELSSSKEFEFLLLLLRSDKDSLSKIESLVAEGICWDHLAQGIFLPQLHIKLQNLPGDLQVPESFKRLAFQSFNKISVLNYSRIRWMSRICKGLYEKGIEILFLKGAAEIIDHCSKSGYLGSRPMADIDFVCMEKDYLQIHRYLLENGNFSYGNLESHGKLDSDILKMTGHYSYNRYGPKLLEMHIDSQMFVHQCDSYPQDFQTNLFENRRQVVAENSEFFIPSREDMLIYMICHAAGEKDYKFLCNRPYNVYDSAIGEEKSIVEKINNRLSSHQIRFLYQIDLFLRASEGNIDFDLVMSELSRLKSKNLIQQHLDLIYFYTEQDVFKKYVKHQTRDALLSSRRRCLRRLLASQILVLAVKCLIKDRTVLILKKLFIRSKLSVFESIQIILNRIKGRYKT